MKDEREAELKLALERPEDLEALLGVPMWVFHDRDDPHIELRHEQEPVERLQALGGDVRLTITETGRHYIHEPVLEQGALFEWFLAHRRGATTRD